MKNQPSPSAPDFCLEVSNARERVPYRRVTITFEWWIGFLALLTKPWWIGQEKPPNRWGRRRDNPSSTCWLKTLGVDVYVAVEPTIICDSSSGGNPLSIASIRWLDWVWFLLMGFYLCFVIYLSIFYFGYPSVPTPNHNICTPLFLLSCSRSKRAEIKLASQWDTVERPMTMTSNWIQIHEFVGLNSVDKLAILFPSI